MAMQIPSPGQAASRRCWHPCALGAHVMLHSSCQRYQQLLEKYCFRHLLGHLLQMLIVATAGPPSANFALFLLLCSATRCSRQAMLLLPSLPQTKPTLPMPLMLPAMTTQSMPSMLLLLRCLLCCMLLLLVVAVLHQLVPAVLDIPAAGAAATADCCCC